MLVAIGFVEETRRAPLLQQRRAAARRRAHRPAPQGLSADLRALRRGPLHSPGDRIRTHEAGAPLGRRSGVSICEDFWHPSLPMLQAQAAPRCSINLAAGPARAPGSAAGLRGDRRLAAHAGDLCPARHRGGGLLQPGRQRGGAHLLGRLAAAGAGRPVLAEAPLYEEALVVGVLADRRPGRCSATACRCWPTSGWSSLRRELQRIIAERAGLPPTRGRLDD